MATKQKSGLYRTKVKVGIDADGNDICKWVSGRTKRELEEERQKIISYYITGNSLATDRMFGEYAIEWYHIRKEPFISESSRNSYKTMLNKHILPEFGDRNLRAIKAADIQRFVNQFAGMSKSQITTAITTMRAIFAAAKADRLVQSNPAEDIRRPIATPPTEKIAFTDAERTKIVEVINTHEYGRYLGVMFYTGMRPGEVRGLQWGDFDWKTNLIHVQRDIDYAGGRTSVGALKTKAADRYIPIAADLKALLYAHREAPGAFVFTGKDGKPLAQTTAKRMWISLMVACGMADRIETETPYRSDDIRGQWNPRITPHAMRHNFITMCWEQGMDILITMKLVGHADYQTTRNIYTHLSEKHLDSAKLKLDEIFKKSCTKVAQTENADISEK